jgi:hypothetical protein
VKFHIGNLQFFCRERSATGYNDCFVVLVSRERSSTGSNDCFVVVVVVVVLDI